MSQSLSDRLDLARGPEPAYARVRDHLARQMAAGVLEDGARLMPERMLAAELGVSRVTVRRALQELVDQGVLTPSHGRGWFVVQPQLGTLPTSLLSFTERMRAEGRALRTTMLGTGVEPADSEQAKALGLRRGTRLVLLRRLRLVDGEPVAITTSWLPLQRFRPLRSVDLTDTSLYGLLGSEFGIHPAHAEFTVSAKEADRDTAKLLGLGRGAPLLAVSQLTHDADGEAFELGLALHRPDRYAFHASGDAGIALAHA